MDEGCCSVEMEEVRRGRGGMFVQSFGVGSFGLDVSFGGEVLENAKNYEWGKSAPT